MVDTTVATGASNDAPESPEREKERAAALENACEVIGLAHTARLALEELVVQAGPERGVEIHQALVHMLGRVVELGDELVGFVYAQEPG